MRSIVVKLGGEVVGRREAPPLAADLAALSTGRAVVVVHGGGPQATECRSSSA